MVLTLQSAELVALFMQAVGYGAHVLTFTACASKMLQPKVDDQRRIRWPLFLIAVALFVIGTLDMAVHLYQNLDAFVHYTGEGGPKVIISSFSSWSNIIRTTAMILSAMVSDAAWIYRCWVVYDRRCTVVALPSVIWIALVVCGAFQIYYQAILKRDIAEADLLSSKIMQQWVLSFGAVNLALDAITTSPIVYRIWSVSKGMSGFTRSDSKLSTVMEVIIESALLYTVDIFLSVVADAVGSLLVYGFASLGNELAGVAYDLILIRLGSTCTGSSIRRDAMRINGSSGPQFTLRVMQSTEVEQRADSSIYNERASQQNSNDISLKDPVASDWQAHV